VWISDHFFIFFTIAEYGIFWTFVSISHTINGRFVLSKILMPIDKIMHSQHFGTDPMGIDPHPVNPKIGIRISDHFRLKFWCWRGRFALFGCSIVTVSLFDAFVNL